MKTYLIKVTNSTFIGVIGLGTDKPWTAETANRMEAIVHTDKELPEVERVLTKLGRKYEVVDVNGEQGMSFVDRSMYDDYRNQLIG